MSGGGSGGGKAAFAAVAALAGAALAAYLFKDQISEALESENCSLLKRCDAAVTRLERGLEELQTMKAVTKQVLGYCQSDLDFITQTLDSVRLSPMEETAGGLKKQRKSLIDRTNVAAEKLEGLQQKHFKLV